jgi:hypothetical protein
MSIVELATGGRGWGLLTPALVGLAAAMAAFGVAFASNGAAVRDTRHEPV